MRPKTFWIVCCATATAILGCPKGGGGGGGDAGPSRVKVTGRAFDGPVQGATAFLLALKADFSGDVIDSATTAADGSFELEGPASSTGCYDIAVQAPGPGASYVDTATGQTIQLSGSEQLWAAFCSSGEVDVVAVTPFTTMADFRATTLTTTGVPIRDAIDAANAAVAQQIGVSSILELPADPADAAALQTASLSQRQYGVVLGGLAKEAAGLGVRSIDLGMELSVDASDGSIDGKDGSGADLTVPAIAGGSVPLPADAAASALQTYVNSFIADSSRNRTALTQHSVMSTARAIGALPWTGNWIRTTTLPAWREGSTETFRLNVSGNPVGATWAVQSGALPAWLVLNPDGRLVSTGAPVTGNVLTMLAPVVLTVTDPATGLADTLQLVPMIAQAPPALTVALPQNPPQQGDAVDFQLATAAGGTGPYYFTLGTACGFPPMGLALAPDGRLKGTVNANAPARNYTFCVCAVDPVGNQTCQDVTLAVVPKPPPPPGGVGFVSGTLDCVEFSPGTNFYTCDGTITLDVTVPITSGDLFVITAPSLIKGTKTVTAGSVPGRVAVAIHRTNAGACRDQTDIQVWDGDTQTGNRLAVINGVTISPTCR